MKKHLLLIDDDIDEFDFIDSLLKEMPTLKFSYACNGKSGIEFMSHDLPDAVLLDMNMPAMNGLECLKKIRKTFPLRAVPIYMYSNCHTESFMREAKELGATDCFKKPTSVANLREILVKILDDSNSR